MLNCNEFRKKGGAIFNTEIIPQNHFSCMIEIEKESEDEPGMITENSNNNMLKESFWHTKIFFSMKGKKSQFMNAFHQCLSNLIGGEKNEDRHKCFSVALALNYTIIFDETGN